MLDRRQFCGAVGALSLNRISKALAAPYDLIIKSGRVIDPSLQLDATRDVAISGSQIAAVAENISGEAKEIIDARGKLVVPGLIDIHVHAARNKEGPPLTVYDGVTAWVDAGTMGADRMDEAVVIAKNSPNLGRLLINISRGGLFGGETDLSRADVALARGAIARHRDMIVGVKARLSEHQVGDHDLEALRRAQEAAIPFGLPVMIHMGQSVSPMRAILPLLKRGDIVTHMMSPPPNAIIDEDGRLYADVLAARRRGVLFDIANGRFDHIRWDVAERVMQQGFWPDTISTDWNTESPKTSVIDLPNVMSKFLLLGMPLDKVIGAATINAARVFEAFSDRGTLNVGAPGDVALLELREGDFEFADNYDVKRNGTQRLFPFATVIGGKRAPPKA